jgi:hypothetical protein
MFVNLEYPSSDKNIYIYRHIDIDILNTQILFIIICVSKQKPGKKFNRSKFTKIRINAREMAALERCAL